MIRTSVTSLVLAVVSSTLLVPAVDSQSRPSSIVRATATVALVTSLPAGSGSALVIRRAREYPRDVLLLREDATAEQLSAAIVALIRARNRTGVIAVRDTVIPVTRTSGPTSWRGGETARAAKWLDRIRGLTSKQLAGIGDAKFAQVLLRSARVTEASLDN